MRTGRRIEKGEHQPNKGKVRPWRTRQDPLAQVWESELVPLLEKNPELRPTTLLEYLQKKYPTQYQQCHLRTLQRRVSQWKATSGPPKDVMFEQSHQLLRDELVRFHPFQTGDNYNCRKTLRAFTLPLPIGI